MNEKCDYFNRKECSSCALLALPEEQRALRKENRFIVSVREVLGESVSISSLWQPKKVFPSRGKAKLSVSGTLKDPVIGLVDRNLESTELLDCPLHLPQLNELLHFLKALITEHKIAPYHIERKLGELKGLILKSNESGSEVIVRFVLRSHEAVSKVKRAARDLQKEFPFVKVVSANIQPLPAAILEGEEEVFLTEQNIIWDNFSGRKVAFQPQSFSQVTHETADALYQHVAKHLKQSSVQSMLDLFCGVGGFLLVASDALKWGHGVELSAQAIECAKLSCNENKIQNLKFEAADVEKFLATYTSPIPDALLFNPPRRGVSPSMIEYAKQLGPRVIVYSSCNPTTLLRDLKLLSPEYTVKNLDPFDMFPLTEHLEVVAFLEKH